MDVGSNVRILYDGLISTFYKSIIFRDPLIECKP